MIQGSAPDWAKVAAIPSNVQPLEICRQVAGAPEHVYGLGVVSSGSLTLQLAEMRRENERTRFANDGEADLV